MSKGMSQLREFDWGDLRDPDSIGDWPGAVKGLIVFLVFVLVLGAGFWFDIRELQARLQQVELEEQRLLDEYRQKAALAANLEVYQEQNEEMEQMFEELLRQLPGQTEVPDLVDDITATGLGSGLAFTRIELDSEVAHEFYIEQPIELDVVGAYHEFGSFVSGVSSLPRIVTLHDFLLEANSNDRTQLNLEITARTYRYRSQEEFE